MKKNFKQNLDTIKTYLEHCNKSSDISELLEKSKINLAKNSLPIYCENELINAVLTIKKQITEKLKIPMEISVQIPQEINILSIDLCSLFCNLLDNAIEACQSIENTPRNIIIKANVAGGFLFVKTETKKVSLKSILSDTFYHFYY